MGLGQRLRRPRRRGGVRPVARAVPLPPVARPRGAPRLPGDARDDGGHRRPGRTGTLLQVRRRAPGRGRSGRARAAAGGRGRGARRGQAGRPAPRRARGRAGLARPPPRAPRPPLSATAPERGTLPGNARVPGCLEVERPRPTSEGTPVRAVAGGPVSTATGALPTRTAHLLTLVRERLRLEVAFIGRFVDGERRYREVATAPGVAGPQAGTGGMLEATYCVRIADGRLPAYTRDATRNAELRALPVTSQLGIRSYLGVPIVLPDGELYGTLCAYGTDPSSVPDPRDVDVLRFVARVLAHDLALEIAEERRDADDRTQLRQLLAGGGPRVHLQPIVDLCSGLPVGFEALARFDGTRRVDEWFAAARRVGMTADLELAAARNALERLADLPSSAYLSLNLSPEVLLDERVREVFRRCDPRRIVVELTEEHLDRTRDGGRVAAVVARGRRRGIRLAIDDFGRGYSDLRRIVELQPEVVKIDRSVVQDVDRDPTRRAVLGGLVDITRAIGATMVAEGIETPAELAALRELRVDLGQGFLLGRPSVDLPPSGSLLPAGPAAGDAGPHPVAV
ncbi:EAL domain-containing protein [Nitriliruptoraceae bacterium ZYF776]|nr:EAL domain-containing protein [Profundirhabdus halotolerans]